MQTLAALLIPINELRPHEEISEENYQVVLQDILKAGVLYNPIFVDKTTKVILDGHHRYTIAKRLKFSFLPCLLIDYFNDSIISVFPRREDIPISKKLVIQAGMTGNLFPNKSTRHVINVTYPSKEYSLDLLFPIDT